MSQVLKIMAVALATCGLVACQSSQPAPVVDAWSQPHAGSAYRVQRGDNLYSIAFAYGFDYHDIAATNHLQFPYRIKAGDLLVLKKPPKRHVVFRWQGAASPTKIAKRSSVRKIKPVYSQPRERHAMHNPRHWRWPVKSKVLQRFTGTFGHSQGIDLAGWKGRPIVATAPGLVVYSGTGVRGYGNLVIIKHSEEYLSAYAYASKRFVHTGEWVKAGQRVAAMGQDNHGRFRLHFELRRKGKPVNPLRYLR